MESTLGDLIGAVVAEDKEETDEEYFEGLADRIGW
jgi:hypothetical protein